MRKSIRQVKENFSSTGKSIADWARENNFPPALVYKVIKNKKIPQRGKSHKIAVKLGLKEGKIMD